MTDTDKTKAQLIEELEVLRAKVIAFEQSEVERERVQEAERRHTIELEMLRQASLSLTASLDLEDIFNLILEYALQLVKADDAHIFTYDGEQLTFGAALWAGEQQKAPFALPRQDGLTYRVARSGEPIVVSDMRAHALFRDQNWEGAIVGLPLQVGERVCGVMSVAYQMPHVMKASELRILKLLADQAAIAVQNAQYVTQIELEITERKQVEEALRQSERQFRDIAKNIPGMVFQFRVRRDGSSYFSYASPRATELFGLPADKNDPDWDVGARVHPDDREGFVASIAQAIEARADWNFEGRMITPPGEIRWFQGISSPSQIGDELVFNGVMLDSTKRKQTEKALRQSEALYRSLFEGIDDAITVHDEEANILDVNEAACRRLGYTREELLQMKTTDIDAPDYAAGFKERLARQLSDGRLSDIGGVHLTKDGRRILIDVNSRLIEYKGKPAVLAVVRDMTERKQAEQQRLELAMERERAAVLRQFVSNASHDLRTPLTIIKTRLYLLGRLADTEPQHAHLEVLDAQTTHLERLLEDMLRMARLDTATPFTFELLDVNELIREVLAQQEPLVMHKSHDVNFTGDPELPLVQADHIQLDRAITNIVLNALHYTPEEGTITLRTYLREREVVIDVQDNGIGIGADDLPRIFERFYRADEARGTVKGGAGLGLAIARRVIEEHQGRIEVESAWDKGSTFSIILPVGELR